MIQITATTQCLPRLSQTVLAQLWAAAALAQADREAGLEFLAQVGPLPETDDRDWDAALATELLATVNADLGRDARDLLADVIYNGNR